MEIYMYLTPPIKTTTLFNRRCCKCKKRKKVGYYALEYKVGTSYEVTEVFYCEDCGEIELQKKNLEIERDKEKEKEIRDEERESRYYDNLKRKVEIAELEKKAAELGIELEK